MVHPIEVSAAPAVASAAAPSANLNPSVASDENPETSPPNESSSPPRKKKKVSKPKHGLTSKVTKTKDKKTKKANGGTEDEDLDVLEKFDRKKAMDASPLASRVH